MRYTTELHRNGWIVRDNNTDKIVARMGEEWIARLCSKGLNKKETGQHLTTTGN